MRELLSGIHKYLLMKYDKSKYLWIPENSSFRELKCNQGTKNVIIMNFKTKTLVKMFFIR